METRSHSNHPSSRIPARYRRLAVVAVLSYCLAAQAVASAAPYYLNTTSGSDSNPGTSTAPWRTLTKVQSAASGDTIVIQSADAATYAAPWPPTFLTERASFSSSPLPGRSTPPTR